MNMDRSEKPMRRLCSFIRSHCVHQDGAVSVEAVLILPVIAWALTASFTFTEAFRHQTTLQKSVYTASDLVSRASGTTLTPQYLDGIHAFMLQMNETTNEVDLRMTLVGWDEDQDAFRVVWSYATSSGAMVALDDTSLNAAYRDQIPSISPGETLLLTEGVMDYQPVFRIGIQDQVFTEIALTRPRFSAGLIFNDPNAPPPPPAWCEFVIDACGM